MDQRVNSLSKEFSDYLEIFDSSNLFVGPSYYFHLQTLSRRNLHSNLQSTLSDSLFYDYLYATLTSWGLHRMGRNNVKLRNIVDLRESLFNQLSSLNQFENTILTEIPQSQLYLIIRDIWSILENLRISVAEFKIVANSKALHHVLPSLVPPIDREYTFKFFYNRKDLSISEKDAFREILLQFHKLAFRHEEIINSRIGHGWHTSETKVIDNAIIGYMLNEKAIEPNN